MCVYTGIYVFKKKKKKRFDFDLITYEDTNSKQWCNI